VSSRYSSFIPYFFTLTHFSFQTDSSPCTVLANVKHCFLHPHDITCCGLRERERSLSKAAGGSQLGADAGAKPGMIQRPAPARSAVLASACSRPVGLPLLLLLYTHLFRY
jgi:hypothetical protein